MSNHAEHCDGLMATPRLIKGIGKPDIETGTCVHRSNDSSCCGTKDAADEFGVNPTSTEPPGTANESYGGSCCDRCGDTNNNQSDPPAGQRCDVETANKSHAGSCNESIPDEESISGCKSGDINSQPTPHTNQCCNIKMSTVCHSVCAGPDDDNSEGLGCGGRCCAPTTEHPDSITVGGVGLVSGKEVACQSSCCASKLYLPNRTSMTMAAARDDVAAARALARASGSSSPLQASAVRGCIGEGANHKCRKHNHGKPNVKHPRARTVLGRLYKATCRCVLNSLKGTSEPSKREQAVAQSKPSFNSLLDIERTGGDDTGRVMKMSIRGMECHSCGNRLAKALHTLPSVREPKVNALAGEATLLYSDVVIASAEIACRATTLTGFRCEVIHEKEDNYMNPVTACPQIRRLRVQVSLMHLEGPSSISVPPSVKIHSAKRSGKDKWILDIDFDSKLIQPRTVLAKFAQFKGVHLPQLHGSISDVARKNLIDLLMRTTISILCCIPVLIFSWAPVPRHPITYGTISLVLTTIIQFYVALPIYSSALHALFFLHIIDMDLLVAVSTSIAYIYSVVVFAIQTASQKFSDQFFETSALLVTLIMLGSLVSAYANRRASSALDDLAALQSRNVTIVHPSACEPSTSTISEELVHTGDVLRILPDTLVPTDGIVLVGRSEVDESSITGESIPAAKAPGTSLVAGTLNLSGTLDMQVTRVPAESTLADISKLLRDAQDAAAALPVRDRADRAAAHLAPVVFVLAIATFVIQMLVGVYLRHHTERAAAIAALKYSIAVMVVPCPCAIVLGVPMVVVLAVSAASKRGVLFKSVIAIQFAKDVSIAIFDKTGTLTEGMPQVVQGRLLHKHAANLVLALTSISKHPISKAVAKYLSSTSKNSLELEGFHSIPGSGIEARIDDKTLRGGSPRWLGWETHPTIVAMKSERLTLFAVTYDGEMIAAFGLQDGLRVGAREAVDMLQHQGVDVHIVSGDESGVVSALAAKLKLDPARAVGGCKPQDKQKYVRALQTATGGNQPPRRVMFFGDGTNDSLALVQADVGVSLSTGTDVAMSAADVVYMDAKNLARSIRTTLDVSEGAVLRIYWNFAWSVIYNTFAILLASGAFVHARVSPQYAGLGEMVSVLPAVLIAWSMIFFKN